MNKYFITETVTYEIGAPNAQEALERFLSSRDRDIYFISVDDRWVRDEKGQVQTVDESKL